MKVATLKQCIIFIQEDIKRYLKESSDKDSHIHVLKEKRKQLLTFTDLVR